MYCFELLLNLPFKAGLQPVPQGIAEDGQSGPPDQVLEQICGTDGSTYTSECGICAYKVSLRWEEHAS